MARTHKSGEEEGEGEEEGRAVARFGTMNMDSWTLKIDVVGSEGKGAVEVASKEIFVRTGIRPVNGRRSE